jgi:lambda repressor-like predicted transcriptional regulator
MQQPAPFRESLAGCVRAELARHQVTVREAAAGAGLAASTLARRLDRGDFKMDELARIAAFLNIPMADLLPAEEQAAS